jgi:sugar lactone lactonase YvrE
MRYRATVASPLAYGLGEGPFWDTPRGRVLWVNVNAGTVHTGDLVEDHIVAGQEISLLETTGVAGTVGAVVPSLRGELLVAGSKAVHTVAIDGTVTTGPLLLPADKPSRLNDGACDPAGRFLVGSLSLSGDRPNEESLIRLEASGTVTIIDDDLNLSNGLAWSPDGQTFYSIDTIPGVVWVRSYDPETGHCGTRETFLQMTNGFPDGMCVDSAGNLWIAVWGGGEVRCYAPTGQQLAAIELAAPNVTSVAFVGADLDILLITTAFEELTPSQHAQYPDSGKLFTCRVEATGSPVTFWSGPG